MKKLLITLTTVASIASLTFAANATYSLEKANDNELNLLLDSNSDVYGLQFDLNYDASEIKLSEESINHMFSNGDSRSNMSVYSKIKTPGLARVIMFDLSGEAIITSDNAENILSMNIEKLSTSNTFSLTIDNVIMAGLHGSEIICSDSQTFDFNLMDSTSPIETKIVGNYPNPFNPVTTVEFDLHSSNQGLVDITIYDIAGRKVATLFSGYLEEGQGYKFNWDASNISSGRYFAQLTAPGFTDTINMTLIK